MESGSVPHERFQEQPSRWGAVNRVRGESQQPSAVRLRCDGLLLKTLFLRCGNDTFIQNQWEHIMEMTEQKHCQSCGMPMGKGDELYGTETNGSRSQDYCNYCYQNGQFLFCGTMAEMIEICVPHIVAYNPAMTAEQARQMMEHFLPMLKRWK